LWSTWQDTLFVSLGVHYAERKNKPERESRFRALADALREHFCGVEDTAGESDP
jgi:hypothetical protein